MKIVYPTDFSAGAEQARAEAMRLAKLLGAEVVVLHVFEDTPLYTEGLVSPGGEEISQAHRKRAEEALAAQVTAVRAAGVTARGLLKAGKPADQIVQVAADEGADFIVVGTYSLGPLDRFFLGSVTDRVVRKAPCPVLTVREARRTGVGKAVA